MTLHLPVPRTGSASGNEISIEIVNLNVDGFVVAQSKQRAKRKERSQPALEA
jgi:hypothetical protein